MKRFIKIINVIAIILCCVCMVSLDVQAATPSTSNKVIEKQSVPADGVTWTSYTENTTNSSGETKIQTINQVDVASSSQARVVTWAVLGTDGIKKSNVLDIAKDYEASHPNEIVVAATNGDYFGATNDVYSTRDPLAIDGAVINAGPDATAKARLYAMALNSDLSLNSDGKPYILTSKGGSLSVSDNYYLDIYDSTGSYVIKTFEIDGINVAPGDNETTAIVNTKVTASNTYFYQLNVQSNKDITSSVAYNNVTGDVYYIKGTVTGKVNLSSETNTTIATKNAEIKTYLDNNCTVKVYRKLTGAYSSYTSVFGTPQQTLKDGTILSTSEVVNYGSHRDIRRARTALGFKEDGSVVLCVFDEYYATANGVDLFEAAAVLKENGCVQGFNLDGGGSSCMAIRQNNTLTIVDTPSDGAPRNVGNAMLVVVSKTDTTLNYTQSYAYNGYNMISGSASITCLNNFKYNSADIYIDGVAQNVSDITHFNLVLDNTKDYDITVVATAGIKKYCLYHETLQSEAIPDKTAPTNVEATMIRDTTGFTINAIVTDPDQVVNMVEATVNGENISMTATAAGYTCHIDAQEEADYSIIIKANYSLNKDSVETKKSKRYTYSFTPIKMIETLDMDYIEQSDGKYTVTVPEASLKDFSVIRLTINGEEALNKSVTVNSLDNLTVVVMTLQNEEEVTEIIEKINLNDKTIREAQWGTVMVELNATQNKKVYTVIPQISIIPVGGENITNIQVTLDINGTEKILDNTEFSVNSLDNISVKSITYDYNGHNFTINPAYITFTINDTTPVKKGCGSQSAAILLPMVLSLTVLCALGFRRKKHE